jgi:hypothetical protein
LRAAGLNFAMFSWLVFAPSVLTLAVASIALESEHPSRLNWGSLRVAGLSWQKPITLASLCKPCQPSWVITYILILVTIGLF